MLVYKVVSYFKREADSICVLVLSLSASSTFVRVVHFVWGILKVVFWSIKRWQEWFLLTIIPYNNDRGLQTRTRLNPLKACKVLIARNGTGDKDSKPSELNHKINSAYSRWEWFVHNLTTLYKQQKLSPIEQWDILKCDCSLCTYRYYPSIHLEWLNINTKEITISSYPAVTKTRNLTNKNTERYRHANLLILPAHTKVGQYITDAW